MSGRDTNEQLTSQPDVETALASYGAIRRPATAQILLMNRANGPEQVMQLAEERAPEGFDDIHTVIPQRGVGGDRCAL